MDISTIGTSLVIVVMAYLIGLFAKLFPKIKDNYIPVIVGIAGGVLGVAGFYLMPEFPAEDVMTAVAVGIMSGLASTGVNQVYKQIAKAGDE